MKAAGMDIVAYPEAPVTAVVTGEPSDPKRLKEAPPIGALQPSIVYIVKAAPSSAAKAHKPIESSRAASIAIVIRRDVLLIIVSPPISNGYTFKSDKGLDVYHYLDSKALSIR
jgi:hypothetical protein